MVDAGVIFVCAAGNDNQRLGIGADDPHLNDYLTTLTTADTRTGVSLVQHLELILVLQDIVILFILKEMDTINQEIFIPTICVGAMDEFIESNYQERQASYSNNGPGIMFGHLQTKLYLLE